MITGRIDDHRAVLPLTVLGVDGRTRQTIDFTLHTGFDGFLTLPDPMVAVLQPAEDRLVAVTLADGRIIDVRVYAARIAWDGAMRDVEVLATGGRPLLGTRMLAGHELVARFVVGGNVTVRPLV